MLKIHNFTRLYFSSEFAKNKALIEFIITFVSENYIFTNIDVI